MFLDIDLMCVIVNLFVLDRQPRTKSSGSGGHKKVPPSSKHRLGYRVCILISDVELLRSPYEKLACILSRFEHLDLQAAARMTLTEVLYFATSRVRRGFVTMLSNHA